MLQIQTWNSQLMYFKTVSLRVFFAFPKPDYPYSWLIILKLFSDNSWHTTLEAYKALYIYTMLFEPHNNPSLSLALTIWTKTLEGSPSYSRIKLTILYLHQGQCPQSTVIPLTDNKYPGKSTVVATFFCSTSHQSS